MFASHDQLHMYSFFEKFNLLSSSPVIALRPVQNKDDNYKDNDKYVVLKIVLNIKE